MELSITALQVFLSPSLLKMATPTFFSISSFLLGQRALFPRKGEVLFIFK
jgi:hypothetical protein